MKMISIITGAIMLAWCFTLIFLVTFSCHPVSFAWDKSIPNGHCLNPNTVYVTLAGVNIGTDLVVLILPMPWLARLQLDLTKKLALIGTFVLGCL